MLFDELKKIHARNYGVYGVRKMWHATKRAGWNIGRDQVARLMKIAGISGVRRGRVPVTTRPAPVPDTRQDLVSREFKASRPNELWVADITYVRTLSGFIYTAFVTDAYSRKIVGWSTKSTMTTEALPLEVLERPSWTRKLQVSDRPSNSLATASLPPRGLRGCCASSYSVAVGQCGELFLIT